MEAAVVPISPLTIVLIPELVTPAEPPKDPNDAAEPNTMGGGEGVMAQETTVNVQVKSAAMVLAGMARSFTPEAPLRTVAR